MKRTQLGLAVGCLLALAACAAERDDELDLDDVEEQRIERATAGREVHLLPPGARDAVRNAAVTFGGAAEGDVRVPRFGAPIFEPGSDAVAFYEVNLSPGWAVVRANGPAEVLEFNAAGQGPTASLTKGTAGSTRVVRLDTALYVATDPSGHALGQSAESIVRIERSADKGDAVEVPISADAAMADFGRAKDEHDRRNVAQGSNRVTPTWFWDSAAPKRSCAAAGHVPSYKQLRPNEAPNDSSCASGCGATAWAMIFGWASLQAASNDGDSAFAGLFRTGSDASGAVVKAPRSMNSDVGNLSWTLRKEMGTFCAGDQGATPTWGMNNVKGFARSRAPGVKIESTGNALMINDNGLRNAVVDALCDGRPSIIGIGTLFRGDGHYPVAKAYKDGMFELDMGWGGNGNGWYKATTWFVGNVRR